MKESHYDITGVVRSAFATEHNSEHCYSDANVEALTWEDNSMDLVAVAEVPPSPQCTGSDAGHFESFVFSISDGKVISHFSMGDTVHRWHSILGPNLLDDIKLAREGKK